MTPLDIAIKGKRNDVIKLLLEHNGKAQSNRLLIEYAAEENNTDLIRTLFDKFGGSILSDILNLSVQHNNVETLSFALSKGANLNTDFHLYSLHSSWKRNLETIFHYKPSEEKENLLDKQKKVLSFLLESGFDVNMQFNKNCQLLHIAADAGNGEIVKMLLNYNAAVNLKDAEGRTALHIAAQHGNMESSAGNPFFIQRAHQDQLIMEQLINHGADVNSVDDVGNTAIAYAIQNKDRLITNLLLEHQADAKVTDIVTLALETQDKSILEKLLAFKKDINECDNQGDTGLHLAVEKHNTNYSNKAAIPEEIVNMLLNRGADPNIVNNKNETPLSIALENITKKSAINSDKPFQCVKLLLCNGATEHSYKGGITELHIAAKKGCMDIVAIMLENNFNVDAVTDSGMTPLHASVINRHIETTNLLVKYTSNKNACNEKGKTALHYAARINSSEMIELLLLGGLDANAVTKYGNTALSLAILSHDELDVSNKADIAALLLDHGATEHESLNGRTELHVALIRKEWQVAKLLISSGFNVKAISKDKFTPLFLASKAWDIQNDSKTFWEVITMLIEKGAAKHCIETTGEAALQVAIEGKNVVLVRKLLDAGFNVDANFYYPPQCECKTPLLLAVEHNDLEIFREILSHPPDINNECNQRALYHKTITVQELSSEWSPKSQVITNYFTSNSFYKIYFTTRNSILKYLFQYGFKLTPEAANQIGCLCEMVDTQCMQSIQELLEFGANVNEVDEFGRTPLFLAIQSGNMDIVKFLIKNEATVHIKELAEVFHEPCKYRKLRILDIIFSSKINLFEHDDTNKNYLHIAVENEGEEIIKFLLERGEGVGINSLSETQEAPLDISFRCNELKIIDLLLEYGANINMNCLKRKPGRSYRYYLGSSYFLERLKIFVAHLVKSASINSFISLENEKESWKIEFKHFSIECEKEIENMKLLKVVGNTTIHNILSKSIDETCKYFKDEKKQENF